MGSASMPLETTVEAEQARLAAGSCEVGSSSLTLRLADKKLLGLDCGPRVMALPPVLRRRSCGTQFSTISTSDPESSSSRGILGFSGVGSLDGASGSESDLDRLLAVTAKNSLSPCILVQILGALGRLMNRL